MFSVQQRALKRAVSAIPRDVRVQLLLFGLTFVVYGYFFGTGSWHQNARYNSVFSFVEPGTSDFLTFRMDRFMVDPARNVNTGDWAQFGGHYYSNKAPGPILLGVPAYAVLFLLERALGFDPSQPRTALLNAYLLNLFVSVLITAAGVSFFYRLLRLRGAPARRAVGITCILAFSTCLFPYSTQLWGHTTAAACVILCFYHLLHDSRRGFFLAGLFGGAAVLTEYLAVVLVLLTGIYVLAARRRAVLVFVAGGLLPLLLFVGYHKLCFGSFFVIANQFQNPEFVEGHRLIGMFGGVSPGILGRLLFSPERGLLVTMPVLGVSVWGAVHWLQRERRNALVYLVLACIALPLSVNAAFNGWHGGATVCARYQIIALPFWVFLIAEAPSTRFAGLVTVVLGAISALNMLAVAATSPICSTEAGNPLYGACYPMLFSGDLSAIRLPPIRLQCLDPDFTSYAWLTAFNLGELMGLWGLLSLLPLALVVVLFVEALKRCLVAQDAAAPDRGGSGVAAAETHVSAE